MHDLGLGNDLCFMKASDASDKLLLMLQFLDLVWTKGYFILKQEEELLPDFWLNI